MISNLCFLVLILTVAEVCRSTQAAPSGAHERKNELKIVCHYHLHTWYDTDFRDYSSEAIDENLCTHIVYTDRVSLKNISIARSFHDGKQKYYDRITDFRKKGVHVSISFFKFNLYEHVKLFNAAEQVNFVRSLVEYMEHYNFDGFDAFWGCKSCLRGSTPDVHPDETSNELMRQLSDAFKPRGWLLSTVIATNKTAIEAGFDIQKLSEYVDWMTVMTINIADKNTVLSAPLYVYPDDINNQLNANWSINYLIEKGVPAHKLVLPVISGGPSFNLVSEAENGLNAPTNRRSSTQFYELCQRIKAADWSVVHDTSRIGSYAYRADEWISYDDVEDVYRKAEYILQMNLGGGSISNLNGDDFENKCNCGKNPLLTAMNQVLRNVGSKNNNCT